MFWWTASRGDKLDAQFTNRHDWNYKQVQTKPPRIHREFVRGMYKKPQREVVHPASIAASLKMPRTEPSLPASAPSACRLASRPLAKVDRPVLVTCETPLKAMAADPVVSAIPSGRVELFEDAGHALFVDDADRFDAVLDDFIQHLPAH